MVKSSMHYPLALILFLFVMFPYLSLVDTPFDTQPYAILFSFGLLFVMFFLKKDLEIPKVLLMFLFVALTAFVRALVDFDSDSILRSLVGYLSVFLIALGGYHTFKFIKGKHFVGVIFLWFFFGIAQLLVNKSFGSFLVARMSTSEDRGVTSLAVEPSFYAIICVFFLVTNDVLFSRKSYSKKTHNLMFLLISIQILFSQSALGFLIFAIYLVSKFLFNSSLKKKVVSFIMALFVFILGYYLFTNVPSLQQSRVGSLLYLASLDPVNLIFMDGSISDRLSHILISGASLFHSYGLGFGIANFDAHAIFIANNSGQFIYDVTQVHFTLGRIMSAWGTAVFELGVVGLLLPGTFIYIMFKSMKRDPNNKSVYKVALVTIFAVMMTSVPIAFPIFGYLIGVFVYLHMHGDSKVRGGLT